MKTLLTSWPLLIVLLVFSCGQNNRTASIAGPGIAGNPIMAGATTANQKLQLLLRTPCNRMGVFGGNNGVPNNGQRVQIQVQPGAYNYYQRTGVGQFGGGANLDLQNGSLFFGMNSQGHIVVAKSLGGGQSAIDLYYCLAPGESPVIAQEAEPLIFNVSTRCGGIGEISYGSITVQQGATAMYPTRIFVTPIHNYPQAASQLCFGGVNP